MNTRKRNLSLIVAGLLLTAWSPSVQAQDCFKAMVKFCDNGLFEDYDYLGQSSYAPLLPGDTQNIELILYSEMDYRLIFCNDPKLGEVEYSIVEKQKERIPRKIKDLTPRKEQIIEKDEYGEDKYDDKGNPIVKGEITVYDTIYEEARIVKKNVSVFSSKTAPVKNMWEIKNLKATKKISVEVIVPLNSQMIDKKKYDPYGCVNILVGHKYSRRKGQFKRF